MSRISGAGNLSETTTCGPRPGILDPRFEVRSVLALPLRLPSSVKRVIRNKKKIVETSVIQQLLSSHPNGVAVSSRDGSPPKGERDASHDPPLALSQTDAPGPGVRGRGRLPTGHSFGFRTGRGEVPVRKSIDWPVFFSPRPAATAGRLAPARVDGRLGGDFDEADTRMRGLLGCFPFITLASSEGDNAGRLSFCHPRPVRERLPADGTSPTSSM